MELRRRRGVATVLQFPIKDGSGNTIVGVTGITPQISTWTDGNSTSPTILSNIAGGVASVSNGLLHWSSLTAAEMAADFIYFVASPTAGTGRRVDLLINCTSIASVTNVASITYHVPVNWASITNTTFANSFTGTLIGTSTNVSTVDHVRDLRTTVYPEVTAPPAASSTLFDRMGFLFALGRNKMLISSVTQVMMQAGDEVTTISFATHTDAAGLFTRNEWK